MFGINGLEFIIVAIVAVAVIGPERLPQYAQGLGNLVRRVRGMSTEATRHLGDEIGSEFTAANWQKLDPRQYDPRRIIKEALLEDGEPEQLQRQREFVPPQVLGQTNEFRGKTEPDAERTAHTESEVQSKNTENAKKKAPLLQEKS